METFEISSNCWISTTPKDNTHARRLRIITMKDDKIILKHATDDRVDRYIKRIHHLQNRCDVLAKCANRAEAVAIIAEYDKEISKLVQSLYELEVKS